MPKDIRLEIKPRNNLVLTKMEEKGIKSVAELCRRAGLEFSVQQAVSKIINLRSSPLKFTSTPHLMEWKEYVLEVARVLECTPEELFSESIRGVRISREVKVFAEVDISDFQRLGGRNIPRQLVVDTDPEKGLQVKEFEAALEQMFRTLTPREEKVLKYRFGFEDGTSRTLEEVAVLFAVNKERIRQIEAKAMRKLRHPARSKTVGVLGRGIGILDQ